MSMVSMIWSATRGAMSKLRARRCRNFRSLASIFPSASRRSATMANADGLSLAGMLSAAASVPPDHSPTRPWVQHNLFSGGAP